MIAVIVKVFCRETWKSVAPLASRVLLAFSVSNSLIEAVVEPRAVLPDFFDDFLEEAFVLLLVGPTVGASVGAGFVVGEEDTVGPPFLPP